MLKPLFFGLLAGIALNTAAAETGVARFQLGDLELIALQDAASTMKNSIFQGADAAALKQLAPAGEVPASVNAFLLRMNGRTILFDTGNGGRRGTLLTKLNQTGFAPESIDSILLTHMHFDHIGGLATETGEAVFSKARLYVSTPERNYWSTPGAGPTGQRAMKALAAYGDRLNTFAFDTEVLTGITALDAGGHTPGHTVFETGSLLILGDLVHGAALQFPNPNICATYDMNMLQAVSTRKSFFEKAAASGKTVAGMHLPFPGVGKISKAANGSYRFTPVSPTP